MSENTPAQASDEPMLLPCPFCGGAARIESNRDWHRLCADHDENCVFDSDDADLMYPAQDGYLKTIPEVWNRRAALKAQPAPTEAQGEPVMWFEAEASAKGQPLRHVIGSMIFSTRMHRTKPEVLNNALWPLYEHPAPVEAQGDRHKLLTIIAAAYQIAGQHDAPAAILDVLADPEGATMAQVEAMPTYRVQGEDSARLDAAHARLLAAVKIYSHGYMQDEAEDEEDCVCGAAQHAEAKEVFAAIAEVERASAETGEVKS